MLKEAELRPSFWAIYIHPKDRNSFCFHETMMVEIKEAVTEEQAKFLAEQSPQFCDGC
jgi:hypothetical protein